VLGLEGLEGRRARGRRRGRVRLRVARANAVRAPQKLGGALAGELDDLAVRARKLYRVLGLRAGLGRRRRGYPVLCQQRGVLGLEGREVRVARVRRRRVGGSRVALGKRVRAPQKLGCALAGERHGLPVGADKL